MAEPALEVRFIVPIDGIPEEHRADAERKAHEAFIMALLRHGDISAGRAAKLLAINRWQLSELMFQHGVSPFDESLSQEELERQVTDGLRSLEKQS